MVSTIFWLVIQWIPRNSDHFDSPWVIVVRLWMNLSLNSMFQLTFELTRVGIHGQDLNLINELSMTYPWHLPESIKRSLAILLLLLQGVIGVTFCFLRDHLIHQEDPFQSLGSPEDLEEMGDQPPPPNTARFLTESEGLDSTWFNRVYWVGPVWPSAHLILQFESWFHRQMSSLKNLSSETSSPLPVCAVGVAELCWTSHPLAEWLVIFIGCACFAQESWWMISASGRACRPTRRLWKMRQSRERSHETCLRK